MVSGDSDIRLGIAGGSRVDRDLRSVSTQSLVSIPLPLVEERTRPLRSAEGFSKLYDRTHMFLFRYIYGIHGGPQEDVEDLTAETYTRAWRARRRFEGDEDAAMSWLLQIGRHLVIDTHRRRSRRGIPNNIEDEVLVDDSVLPEVRAQQSEQNRVLMQMLDTLPDDQREILVLRYILGWRVKAIASYLDMKPNTVSVMIRRMLKRLRSDWPRAHHPIESPRNELQEHGERTKG